MMRRTVTVGGDPAITINDVRITPVLVAQSEASAPSIYRHKNAATRESLIALVEAIPRGKAAVFCDLNKRNKGTLISILASLRKTGRIAPTILISQRVKAIGVYNVYVYNSA